MNPKPKNILLITADEMRADCTGFSGNPDVKTPNLDRFASEGTVYSNHFAVFPKCVPSRASMHTGRYTHTDGLRTVMGANHIPEGTPNLAERLKKAGYETAVFGLNHVWEEEWFRGRGEQANKLGEGLADYNSFTDGALAEIALKERFYPESKERSGVGPEGIRAAGLRFKGLNEINHSRFSDDNRTDQAILYLDEVRDRDKPFFLQLNLSDPHPPYEVHEPWYSMYQPEELDPFPFELPTNAPLAIRAQRKYRTGDDFPRESARELQAVYYGMVSYVDDLVGRLLRYLSKSGLEDDTLIVFTSDHGDYAGQFGLIEKWDASLHDSLLKVPFIMKGPGVGEGAIQEGLSEHVDLPATVIDYLKMEAPQEWVWHGDSMLGPDCGKEAVFANGGHEKSMRDRFCCETWEEIDGERFKAVDGKQLVYEQEPDAMARCKMVRTKKWKLVARETEDHELYDLEKDPHELNNIYSEGPLEIILDLQNKLIKWALMTDTDRPFLSEFGA